METQENDFRDFVEFLKFAIECNEIPATLVDALVILKRGKFKDDFDLLMTLLIKNGNEIPLRLVFVEVLTMICQKKKIPLLEIWTKNAILSFFTATKNCKKKQKKTQQQQQPQKSKKKF